MYQKTCKQADTVSQRKLDHMPGFPFVFLIVSYVSFIYRFWHTDSSGQNRSYKAYIKYPGGGIENIRPVQERTSRRYLVFQGVQADRGAYPIKETTCPGSVCVAVPGILLRPFHGSAAKGVSIADSLPPGWPPMRLLGPGGVQYVYRVPVTHKYGFR